jgi:Domain of unknown function (DUF4350)
MTKRLDVILVIACTLVLVLLTYERSAVEGREHSSIASTYDTGPNGYRALFEVLRGAGVPATRLEKPLTLLDPSVRTLVITGYEDEPNAKPLDEREVEALRDFVSGGGRLVEIDAQFAGPEDIAPGVAWTYRVARRYEAIALTRNRYTQGVARVRGPIDWTFAYWEAAGIPLLANDDGLVAVWYRVGRGDVIGISAPPLFGNAHLRNADNLRFAYNAIAGHGPVAFDEYVHGYDDSLTLWGVLPAAVRAAVWIVIVILALALIGANVPFAPPLQPAPAGERTSADYITAIAELMRRSRGRPPDSVVLAEARARFVKPVKFDIFDKS